MKSTHCVPGKPRSFPSSSTALAAAVMFAAVFARLPGSDPAAAPLQEVLALDGDVGGVHDPTAIKDGTTYYLFSTGGRAGQGVIPIRTSTNLRSWKSSGFVFPVLPEWAAREIP